MTIDRSAALALVLLTVPCAGTHVARAQTPCVGGFAGPYPCENVDLMAYVPLSVFGSGRGNDIWGWTDPTTGDEYALMGLTDGTAFVKVTDPVNPVFVGKLPRHATGVDSVWRDIKVYRDHAFIVADSAGNHGMQVFDMTQIRNVTTPPVTFGETAWYGGNNLRTAHNIAIDEATGFAYVVGDNSTSCVSGGLHIVDLATPTNPTFAGCYDGDGYTHDTQCVVYAGVDQAYVGRELCFSSNEDTLTIVDVTDKVAPILVSRTGYPGASYTHQGWLTEDHRFFLLDDELDELRHGHDTRTRVFDLTSLAAPTLSGAYDSGVPATDHNMYVVGDHAFQANYRSGLRVLDVSSPLGGNLARIGYFDVYPGDDDGGFNGAWSVYPYFPSGNVVVSGIEQGLFVLRPRFCPAIAIAPRSLPAAIVSTPYVATLGASGGAPPYLFAIDGGALPPGLALDAGGTISGTPVATAATSFTVSATDSQGCRGTAELVLAVTLPGCPSIALAPPTLPPGLVGSAYAQQLSASGGSSPHAFAVSSGSLPPGLALSSTGLVSGSPATAGITAFVVAATDTSGCVGAAGYRIDISQDGCGTIVLAPPTLPAATVDLPYAATLTAGGGAPPYLFTLAAGTLPPGISLSAGGALSGSAALAGSYTFSISATDGVACTGTRSYVIDAIGASDDASFVAGMGPGLPNPNRVRVLTGDGVSTQVDFEAYAAGTYGTNVAAGDVDGGGVAEIVTGPGPGGVFGPQCRAFRRDASPITKVNFYAYGTLRFGLNPGSGDLDGDGLDEILTGPGPGAVFGPHARAFDYDGTILAALPKVSFYAYGTLKYGAHVVAGDVEEDGFDEILTGPGPGSIFGPQARGFDFDRTAVIPIPRINFFAFAAPQFGLELAGGDGDGDGFDEIVGAPGPGPSAAFPARYKGFDDDGVGVVAMPGFDVTPYPTLYGGRVALGDIDHSNFRHHQGKLEVVTGAGPDPAADSAMKAFVYDGASLAQLPVLALPFGTAGYGVSVAAGQLGY